MMRQLIACTLAFAAVSVHAGTRVSSNSYSTPVSRASACQGAKDRISIGKSQGERVVAFGQCDCDQDKSGVWHCTVNARLARDEKSSESDDESESQGGSYTPSTSSGGGGRLQPAPTGVLGGVR